MSAQERTGWRDEEISTRHRMFGRNAPAVDLDFVVAEFDNRQPVAIIDYKRGIGHPAGQDAGLDALGKLHGADGKPLPLYVVRYDPSGWIYTIEPRNDAARRSTFGISVHPRVIPEDHFVGFLHNLRKRAKPRVGREGRTI